MGRMVGDSARPGVKLGTGSLVREELRGRTIVRPLACTAMRAAAR